MNETANSNAELVPAAPEDQALEARMMWIMGASVGLAVIVSTWFAPWRVTSGLLLGGALSLFNYHWLRVSTVALVKAAAMSGHPGSTVWRYVFRYFVVGSVIFAAYQLKLISVPATIIGLCSYVIAVFAEAFRQFYFAILHREGIN